MDKENLILVGGGGHAIACLDVINSTNKYNIIGYIDFKDVLGEKYGIKYLGCDSEIKNYIKSASFLITVGQINNYELRLKLFKKLEIEGAKFATVISPNSVISKYVTIGKGTIIMHHVVVQSGAVIGDNCILNDKSLIEHNVIIGNHTHISTAAVLNGDVFIGNCSFIGSSSVIKNGIRVDDNSLVGMGSVVLKDIGVNEIWVGNPAKLFK